jgi:hypothetical protein
MRYDPRFPRACAAGRAAAIVNAVLVETDRMLEEDADTHDIVLPDDVPWCAPVSLDDLVPSHAVWDGTDRVFLFVVANPPPASFGDEWLVSFAGGITEAFNAGEPVLVANDNRAADAWNRRRATEMTIAYDWADDERGAA